MNQSINQLINQSINQSFYLPKWRVTYNC